MRRSIFLKLEPTFGPKVSRAQFGSLSPSPCFNDGTTSYRSTNGNTCIEQEFKGRLAYLHQFDLVLQQPSAIEIQTKQKDVYVIYPLLVEKQGCISTINHKSIAVLDNRRAFYLYLPSDTYLLKLKKGKYQFFGFYFDVGIFDDGADNNFAFLKELLYAYRQNASAAHKSMQFKIGHLTTHYINRLCANIKTGDIDRQVSLLMEIKNLIKLSLTKIEIANGQSDYMDLYLLKTKELIELGVEKSGMLFSLNSLTDTIPMSLSYLNRIFKQKTGQTMVWYKKFCIIEKAKKQLYSEARIGDISELYYFTDSRTFRRLFKNFVGITPDDYRKKVKDVNRPL
ncbi:helix-turn-helix domain-containing protein [Sphingobacterium sp. JB170]|uniref:helix-turn-helix domain-containing protein n=1 Tax=Sphingobacterium sp. JB170 TaxID=1434842 RepID=UPI00097F651F|nr:helix-turn-helix domain-containing protein [Sphingobacterium sp. JB170]SJN49846.1 hypothetical protein FM107_19330 [Sphingobacterium sp. JB170]